MLAISQILCATLIAFIAPGKVMGAGPGLYSASGKPALDDVGVSNVDAVKFGAIIQAMADYDPKEVSGMIKAVDQGQYEVTFPTHLVNAESNDRAGSLFLVPQPSSVAESLRWSAKALWPYVVAKGYEMFNTAKDALRCEDVHSCMYDIVQYQIQQTSPEQFGNQATGFKRGSGIKVLATTSQAKKLKANYAYALLSYDSAKKTVELSDPTEGAGKPFVKKLQDVQADIQAVFEAITPSKV